MKIRIARGNAEGFQTYLKKYNAKKLEDGELFLNKETKELYCGTEKETLVFKGVPIPETGEITIHDPRRG